MQHVRHTCRVGQGTCGTVAMAGYGGVGVCSSRLVRRKRPKTSATAGPCACGWVVQGVHGPHGGLCAGGLWCRRHALQVRFGGSLPRDGAWTRRWPAWAVALEPAWVARRTCAENTANCAGRAHNADLTAWLGAQVASAWRPRSVNLFRFVPCLETTCCHGNSARRSHTSIVLPPRGLRSCPKRDLQGKGASSLCILPPQAESTASGPPMKMRTSNRQAPHSPMRSAAR